MTTALARPGSMQFVAWRSHRAPQTHTPSGEPAIHIVVPTSADPAFAGDIACGGRCPRGILRRTLSLLLMAGSALGTAEAAAPKPASQEIDWHTSPLDLDLRGMNGERYSFTCPPGKPQPRRVTGSGPYTDDSPLCTAAVHAGAIHAKEGGDVTIEIRPGNSGYVGSERNYVRSNEYPGAWGGSFVVLPPANLDSSGSRSK